MAKIHLRENGNYRDDPCDRCGETIPARQPQWRTQYRCYCSEACAKSRKRPARLVAEALQRQQDAD